LPATDPDPFDVGAAAEAVADGLTAQGFDVRTFASEDCRYLKIDNVPSVVANLTMFGNGAVDWEYHCFDGNPHDVALMTAITLAILRDDDRPAGAVPDPHVNLVSGIGQAALAGGLNAAFGTPDCGEVAVTNPDRPERGSVRVSDFGDLWWSCRLHGRPQGAAGLDLEEITRSVARAITCAQAARRGRSLPGPVADPRGNSKLGILQSLDDAIAYRLGKLEGPCGACSAGGRCHVHANDDDLIESYREMHAGAFRELVQKMSPDEVAVIMQPGDARPLTGIGVAMELLAGMRKGDAGGSEPKAP
jgi:hypothetical protein